MTTWELLDEKKGEFGPWLRRAFWLPLRQMLRMFHILPVTAALVVFVLLAIEGQLREIYVSYLEDLGSAPLGGIVLRFAAAALGFGLISAALYEAQYRLSAARINVIYSINSDAGARSMLRHVQEVTAIALALSPWLGLVAGLLHAKVYLAGLFAKLAAAHALDIAQMQHVPIPSAWSIVIGVLVLGLVMSWLAAGNPKRRVLQRAVLIATPPGAALLFLLLIRPPQTNPTLLEIAATGACVLAVIGLYTLGYVRLLMLPTRGFSRTLQERTGFNLRQYHRSVMFGWALLPWILAIALYFCVGAPAEANGLHGWAMISVAASWVSAIGLFVVFLLHRNRDKPWLRRTIYCAVGSLAVAGLLASWLPPDAIVTIYRLIGPLGSLSFALLFLISILVLLAVLSQQSGFPAVTLVVAALVGCVLVPIPIGWTVALLALLCLGIFVVAAVARLGAVACVAIVLALTGAINFAKLHGMPVIGLRASADGLPVQTQFVSWLARAETAAPAGGNAACAATDSGSAKPFPVFIVAVEGGGIYAASAGSMFLARLQDRNPCFARHVFAISAVSGGAIGATIFQTAEQSLLLALRPGATPQAGGSAAKRTKSALVSNGCVPPRAARTQSAANDALEMEVCAIIEDDHFSPLVASIFPELIGFTRSGRAQELAASFDASVRARNPAAANLLDQKFDSFAAKWSKDGDAPALVLNSTWVETGYRVAFAPFPLHAIDGSLYSFADQDMPDDKNLTLLRAAVVSARFPAVLPPYSLLIRKIPSADTAQTSDGRHPSGTMRWNFVDGGYSDTSGAATAFALYRALKSTATQHHAVLRVVLITSSDPRLDVDNIDGTAFADTLGPINAMLSVRGGLGNEAVARACDGILGAGGGAGSEAACENLVGKADSPLQIVGVEDETYGLSLGWKISRTTFGVVSWMLGEPQFAGSGICKGHAPLPGGTAQANGQFTLNEMVVCANSRAQAAILQALK